jgi:myo-inositol-1(or 4)-monophosphatase
MCSDPAKESNATRGEMVLKIDLIDALGIAQAASQNAGEILLAMQGTAQVRHKDAKDLVTDADLAAQKAICQAIFEAFPDHGFLGEEGSTGMFEAQEFNNANSDYQWVVDPLDGTTNYAHGFPQYAVSIALTFQQMPVLGVVYDPVSKEMFWAVEGHGAWLNDRRISVSHQTELSQALVAVGLAPNLSRDSYELRSLIHLLMESQAVRRLGSAALNLCYVACGRLDGFWASSLKIWDIAAGVLIVREAGGVVSDLKGQDSHALGGALIAASTRTLQDRIGIALENPPDNSPKKA